MARFLHVIQTVIPVYRMTLPTFRVGLLTLINPMAKFLTDMPRGLFS